MDSEINLPVTYVCKTCYKETASTSQKYPEGTRLFWECGECRKERRSEKFSRICPSLYLESDISRLPSGQLNSAIGWKYNPTGILLIGPTGSGKSRIAWRLIKRLLTEDKEERRFVWFDCIAFGHEIARHYKQEDAEDWLDSVAAADILFFDDLGKLKMTERAETELFGLIERRCAKQLPIIATTNDTGDSLAARMTENRGPAMIRRLREFCDIITF